MSRAVVNALDDAFHVDGCSASPPTVDAFSMVHLPGSLRRIRSNGWLVQVGGPNVLKFTSRTGDKQRPTRCDKSLDRGRHF